MSSLNQKRSLDSEEQILDCYGSNLSPLEEDWTGEPCIVDALSS